MVQNEPESTLPAVKTRDAYERGFQQQMAAIQEEFMRVKSPLLALQTHQPILAGLNRQASFAAKA